MLLEPTGPLITSALSDLPFEQSTVAFGPGDSLLLYTDGVTEAAGPMGMFGPERLVSLVTAGSHHGSGLLDEILTQLATFSGSPHYLDDVTLLTIALPASA